MRDQEWGPSDQNVPPPETLGTGVGGVLLGLFGWVLLALFARAMFGGSGSVFAWMLGVLVVLGLARFALPLVAGAVTSPAPPPAPPAIRPAPTMPLSQSEHARQRVLRAGGGAYLGQAEHGRWVVADRETAVMVLGPPRSGKTSAVVIPAVMGAPGAVVATSTKPDVMHATLQARSEMGDVWLFDPVTTGRAVPAGVRCLRWSPVAAASSWDEALGMARAMTACTRAGFSGVVESSHWTERAAALLAPLLYAAYLDGRPVSDVARWVLRGDLDTPGDVLVEHEVDVATDMLIGIRATEERERSGIFSATAGVLAAYNSDGVRTAAAQPNFDPDKFVASTDTIYITAPSAKQSLAAPLVVGLLEQVRNATYRQATAQKTQRAPVFWALDEVANIASIHDLPALASEAGGQNLHLLVCLQDLSQARGRWGGDAADGFLSLFQTKLILNGIADSRTLESISLALGEYDRELTTTSTGQNHNGDWLSPPGRSEGINYITNRQRVLTPGEIARLPDRQALLLEGTDWRLIRLTPWHQTQPWRTIGPV